MFIEGHISFAKALAQTRSSGTPPSRVTNIPDPTNFAGRRSSSVASKTNQRQKSKDEIEPGNTASLFPLFNSKSKNNDTYLDVIRFILATKIPKGYKSSSELLSGKGDFFKSLTEVEYENGKPKGIQLKQNQRIGFHHLSKTKQEEIKQGKDVDCLQAMVAFSEILFTLTSILFEETLDKNPREAEYFTKQINEKNPEIIKCFVENLEKNTKFSTVKGLGQCVKFREYVLQWVTQLKRHNELPSTL